MPITTGKISWRANSPNKTLGGLLNALKEFFVNSGNYTVIADQITASNYFVVQSTRDTGFQGDKIVAQIIAYPAGTEGRGYPYLGIHPCESWSGTTATNMIGGIFASGGRVSGMSYESYSNFSFNYDTDLWISCDNTFILSMSQIFNDGWCSPVNGIACFERLSGDTDPGTFYGRIVERTYNQGSESQAGRIIYVPKRFDGVVGVDSYYNITTKLGSSTSTLATTLNGPDEGDRHVIFDLGVSRASYGKFKGRIFGFNLTTYCNDFFQGCLLPSPSNAQYIVSVTPSLNKFYNTLMQVSTNITTITT